MLARIDDTQPQFEKRKAMAEHEQTLGKAESDVDIRYSISAEAVAAAELKKAVDADKRVPGSVTQVERDRLELNERKAELQIEQAELERRLATLTAQAKEVEVDAAISAISRRVINSPLAGIVVKFIRISANGCSLAIRWRGWFVSISFASKAMSIVLAGILIRYGIDRLQFKLC